MGTTDQWLEELKSISVLELSERIKALEEAFGVSATAVAAAAPATGGGGEAAEEVEEQTSFDVILTAGGDRPGPEGGQGPRRRGPQARQGGDREGRGREAQGRDRRGRRRRRAQVA